MTTICAPTTRYGRLNRKRAFAILPLSLMLIACPAANSVAPEQEQTSANQQALLNAAGQDWRSNYAAGDWDALRALYADDAVLMSNDQPKITGADDIVTFLRRLSETGAEVEFRFENEEAVLDQNSAPASFGFVTAKYRMDVTLPGEAPVVVSGRSFLVYKWEDGAWKLWRDIDNFSPDVTPEGFE